ASIDLKADEGAMQQLMAERGMPVRFFTATQLAEVEVPNPSEVVRRYTGTPSVSEAAALLVAGQVVAAEQATVAVQAARPLSAPAPQSALLVEKHKLRGPDGRNATVSVAACTGWRSTT
ncbi:MAG: cobalamin biosynthesis protein, partial [Lautropia sp.]|nr:cobalamin biosynthesis protein [Lautropia sp.]